MKKALFLMSVLLTLGLFSACSNNGEMDFISDGGEFVITDSTLIPDDGVVLKPIVLHDERGFCSTTEDVMLCDFFDYQLPLGKRSDSFFVDSDKSECYVINSLEELANIYKGNIEIPEIDFEKYTLVIGQEVMPDFYHPVYKQDLMFNDRKCHLTLYVPDFELDHSVIQYFYYWSLYPKFNTESISVGFIKEKSVLRSVEDVTGYVWINPFRQGVSKEFPESWSSLPNPYDGYVIHHEWRIAGNDHYFPINLPEDFVVDEVKGTNVKFSGKVVEMTHEAREQLEIPDTGAFYYFIYLTKIEIND